MIETARILQIKFQALEHIPIIASTASTARRSAHERPAHEVILGSSANANPSSLDKTLHRRVTVDLLAQICA